MNSYEQTLRTASRAVETIWALAGFSKERKLGVASCLEGFQKKRGGNCPAPFFLMWLGGLHFAEMFVEVRDYLNAFAEMLKFVVLVG